MREERRRRAPRQEANEEAPATMPARWSEGRWNHLTNYRCADCKFATTDRAAIEDHVRRLHPLPSELPVPPAEEEAVGPPAGFESTAADASSEPPEDTTTHGEE